MCIPDIEGILARKQEKKSSDTKIQIKNGPSYDEILRSLKDGNQIVFSSDDEESQIVVIDLIGVSSERVQRKGRILRSFDGNFLVQGIVLVNKVWHLFRGQYSTDSKKGEIAVDSSSFQIKETE